MSIKRKYILTALIGLCIVSCIRLNENGYNQLAPSQKERVVESMLPIDSLPSDGKVYLVSVAQMKDYIRNHQKVIIYEYGAYCHSENCLSPQSAEDISLLKGYDFCLLLDSFSHFLEFPMTVSPVLASNPESFGLKQGHSCIELMINELTERHLGKNDYGRFYVFKDGHFVGSINNIKEL